MEALVQEKITEKIYYIREKKVMLDRDLAELYQVETKVLNQAVKRNQKRFPSDFMFQLSSDEMDFLRSQIVTLKNEEQRGKHSKYNHFAFTEHGIAMLSSVLRSDIAIEVNISIMRTFTKLREFSISYKDIIDRLDKTDRASDEKFKIIFDTLKQIMLESEEVNKKVIGFVNG